MSWSDLHTKIINNLLKDCKIMIFKVIFLVLKIIDIFLIFFLEKY